MADDRKKEGDSLYWVVEKACSALQYEVAASHARRGNKVVVMTNRRPVGAVAMEQDYGDDAARNITECGTKGWEK